MTKPSELFSHFACVLPVTNMNRSLEFYRDKLGFNVTFTWNDPIDYAVLKRGDVGIHLTKSDRKVIPTGQHTSIFIFVHDADAVYEEFIGKQVAMANPIGDRDYRMRDFDLIDPDGYILTFGKGLD